MDERQTMNMIQKLNYVIWKMIKYYREKGTRLENDLWRPEDRGCGSGWGEATRAEVAELWRFEDQGDTLCKRTSKQSDLCGAR